jgi:hypothetical protein
MLLQYFSEKFTNALATAMAFDTSGAAPLGEVMEVSLEYK